MLDLEFLKVIEYDLESVNVGFLCNRLQGQNTVIYLCENSHITLYVVAIVDTKTQGRYLLNM